MKVWVTRDDDNYESCVTVWDTKPILNGPAYRPSSPCVKFFWYTLDVFDGLFRFVPCKGSCKQYELSLKEIE